MPRFARNTYPIRCLELTVVARATVIVPGDQDLLLSNSRHEIPILKPVVRGQLSGERQNANPGLPTGQHG